MGVGCGYLEFAPEGLAAQAAVELAIEAFASSTCSLLIWRTKVLRARSSGGEKGGTNVSCGTATCDCAATGGGGVAIGGGGRGSCCAFTICGQLLVHAQEQASLRHKGPLVKEVVHPACKFEMTLTVKFLVMFVLEDL
jgi:phage FluMu protein Com